MAWSGQAWRGMVWSGLAWKRGRLRSFESPPYYNRTAMFCDTCGTELEDTPEAAQAADEEAKELLRDDSEALTSHRRGRTCSALR